MGRHPMRSISGEASDVLTHRETNPDMLFFQDIQIPHLPDGFMSRFTLLRED